MHKVPQFAALTAAVIVVTLLSGCSGSSPTPTSKAATAASTNPSVAELMKSDEAAASAKPQYTSALATLTSSCQDGANVTFSVEANASASHKSRLQLMQEVANAITGKKNQDCDTALLDAASGSPIVASTPTDTPQYLLGDEATTKTPWPDCSLAVANWTASSGHVVLMVMNVPGPTNVHALIMLKSGATKTSAAIIAGGQTAHDFQLPDIPADQIASVQISVSTNDFGSGGTCMVTGGPNA